MTEPVKPLRSGEFKFKTPDSWKEHVWKQVQSLDFVADAPTAREYLPNGLPADWDYETAELGPNNEALPGNAIGWNSHAKPDFGPGVPGVINKMLSIFHRPIDPEEAGDAYTPWDDPVFGETISAAWEMKSDVPLLERTSEDWKQELESLKTAGSSILEYGTRTIQNIWEGIENLGGVAEPIAYAARGLGMGFTGVCEMFALVAREYERALGPSYLAANEINERTNARLGDERTEWQKYIHNIPFLGMPLAIGAAKVYIAQGYATEEEYRDLEIRYKEAGRIAYSAASDHMLREEYIRRLNEGVDPRLLAMELGHPGKEMLGQMLNDPMFFVDMAMGKAKAQMALTKNRGIYATAADPAMIDNLAAVATTRVDDLAANTADDIARTTKQIYDNARAGISELSIKRGFFNLTAGGQRTDHLKRMSNFIQGIFAHTEQNIDDTMDVLEGMVRAADPEDRVQQLLGVQQMSRSGMNADTLFSTAANETAVTIREILVDSTGKFNPSFILETLGTSPTAADVAETFGQRLDDVLRNTFPNVEERVVQNAKYMELLDTSADEAAKYLASHPGAAIPVPQFQQTLDKIRQAGQKYFYRPVAGIQGTLYMSASPAYRMKNRLGNAIDIFVEQGPIEGIKNILPRTVQEWFGWGPTAAADEIGRWTGGIYPEGMTRGIGPAGGGPVDVSDGILGRFNMAKGAASDEAAAAASVMRKSIRDSMRKALQDGRAFDTTLLASFSDDERALITRLVKQNHGDISAAEQAYRSAATEGHNISRNLSFADDALVNKLQDLGLYDDAQRRVRAGESLDEVLDSLDELADEYETIGMATARESAYTDLIDETGLGRVTAEVSHGIEEGVSQKASDLFERGRLADQEAIREIGQVADDIEAMARRNITIDFEANARLRGQPPKAGVEAAETYIDEILKPFADDVDTRISDTFDDARNYTRDTWAYNNASKTRGRDLRRLWYEAQLPGNPPEELTGGRFRDILWDNYHRTQDARFIDLREYQIGSNRVRAETLASYAQLSPEELMTRLQPASVAHSNARMFDMAKIAPDGTAYINIHPQNLVDDLDRRYLEIGAELGMEHSQGSFKAAVEKAVTMELGEGDLAVYGTRGNMLYSQDASIQQLAREGAKRYGMEPIEFLDNLVDGIPPYKIEIIDGQWSVTGPNVRRITFVPPQEGKPALAVGRYVIETGQGTGEETLKFWLRDLVAKGETEFDSIFQTAEKVVGERLVDEPISIPGGAGFYRRMEEKGYIQYIGDVPGTYRLGPDRRYRILAENLVEDTGFRLDLVAPADAGTPSVARFFHETSPVARAAVDELKEGLTANWGRMQDAQINPQMERELAEFVGDARAKITEARNISVGVATDTRDFVLHDYGKRYGFDLALGYIYPYQFWHSRTYGKWLKRLVSSPYILASYSRYRENREAEHAGLPDWWKYNISSNEIPGIETDSPIYFNLEAALNPLNGMTGVDFDDPDRRQTWLTSMMDGFNKLGPSVWTPYQLAAALYYHEQGRDDIAAKFAGRLYTPTRTIRDVTALMGFEEGKGIELDPFIRYFSEGANLGPYEIDRVGRMLGNMVGEGVYPEADIIDAGYNQEGPIWDEATTRSIHQRAPNLGQIAAPFILGSGLKPRTASDVEIDRFWGDIQTLFNSKPLMSPEEYRQAWDALEQSYNFMDTLLLSRKSGVERDEALAWNVLGRVAPGQMDEIAEIVGVPTEMIDAFYDSKGELLDMSESDRMHFMASVIDMNALLDLPDAPTRAEWNATRASYRQMMDMGERMFGDDIWERADAFWASDDKDAFKRNHPQVEAALDWKQQMIMSSPLMAAYYTSGESIERYYKGLMYSEAEKLYGEDLWDHWDVYSQLKDRDKGAAKRYFRDHPQLKQYLNFRDARLLEIAEQVAKFGAMIPEMAPVQFREGMEPEEEISLDKDRDAWIRAQVMSYLAGGKGVGQIPQGMVPEMLRALLGEEAYRLYLDHIYLGEDLPQALEDKLKELGIEY